MRAAWRCLVEHLAQEHHVAAPALIAQPGRHVHGPPEVVEAVVGGHRDHRPDVHAELEYEWWIDLLRLAPRGDLLLHGECSLERVVEL